MITLGFAFGIAGEVTLDELFPKPSAYIYVGTAGGDIVFENSNGDAQWFPNAGLGYHPIAARKILTNATIDSVLRTTTATGMNYGSTNIP